MNKYRFIKLIVYVTLGILVLVFNQFCLEYVGYVVATFMMLYALEDIFFSIKDGIFNEGTKVFTAIIEIILAIILVTYKGPNEEVGYVVKLVIWAVWTMLAEGKEVTECLIRFKEKKPALLNLAESLISIGFAIAMLLEPTEHHAHTHVFLLGIELITNASFYYLYNYLDKLIEKRKKSKELVKESEE